MRIGESDPPHFFVSYTSADVRWAEWIAHVLEDSGYHVTIQAWDMVPGSNWIAMMNDAARRAQRTIAVLSAEYLTKSEFGAAEWQAAFRRDPDGASRLLLPVRIEDCPVDGLLAGVVGIDLFDRTEQDARQALLTGINAAETGRAKPVGRLDFPGSMLTPP